VGIMSHLSQVYRPRLVDYGFDNLIFNVNISCIAVTV
jgi:hypothetical protein